MKKILTLCVCSFFIFSGTQPISGKKIPTQSTINAREMLDMIDSDILTVELEKNRLIWEEYLSICKSSNSVVSIFVPKSIPFSADMLYDTVPAIKKAQENYNKASEELREFYKQDSAYTGLEERYKASEGDGKQRAAVRLEYEEFYARLKAERPEEYMPARYKEAIAFSNRNIEIAKFLLEYYQKNNKIMPHHEVILDKMLNTIMEIPKIADLDSELEYLKRNRLLLQQQYYDAKYRRYKDVRDFFDTAYF